MAEGDRRRWDERYATQGPPPVSEVEPPDFLARHADLFPTAGRALDLACGQGLGAVWLARRGLDVWGFDVSTVAIGQARELTRRTGVGDRCRFDVFDLDDGLPAGPPVTSILCHKFRDRRLDQAIIERLAPGGLLAIVRAQRSRCRAGTVSRSSRRAARRVRRTRTDCRRRGRRSRLAAGTALRFQASSLARTAASRSSNSASSMTPRTTSECASATSRFSG